MKNRSRIFTIVIALLLSANLVFAYGGGSIGGFVYVSQKFFKIVGGNSVSHIQFHEKAGFEKTYTQYKYIQKVNVTFASWEYGNVFVYELSDKTAGRIKDDALAVVRVTTGNPIKSIDVYLKIPAGYYAYGQKYYAKEWEAVESSMVNGVMLVHTTEKYSYIAITATPPASKPIITEVSPMITPTEDDSIVNLTVTDTGAYLTDGISSYASV
jgi:hypothetical protein